MGQNKPSPVDLKDVKLPFGGFGFLEQASSWNAWFSLGFVIGSRT